jgi:hypothetical protein
MLGISYSNEHATSKSAANTAFFVRQMFAGEQLGNKEQY